MGRKEVIQGIIHTMQSELPFETLDRELNLPTGIGQIITVAGVRRCGKSYMLKIVANRLIASGVSRDRILWINFDDERLDGMTSEDLDEILRAYREMYPDISLKDVHMFFDEIQSVEKWELFVLRVYKTYCRNIYISGSNAHMLSAQLSSALRGWPIQFEAFPLSFGEYLSFKGLEYSEFDETLPSRMPAWVREYLHASSFPEVVLMKDESLRIRKVQGYFNTMLFRDLVEHYGLSNPETVRYFLKRLMLNLTKPTSVNSIFNDIKSQGRRVDKNKLYALSEMACEIFLFFKVTRWTKSLIQETSRLPKYYVIDNGMRNSILLPQSDDDGKLLENAVFLQLRRRLEPDEKITYFSEDFECDFVIQKDEHISRLIQVCWTLDNPDTLRRELRGLTAAAKATGCEDCTIVTFDEEELLQHEGLTVKVVPAWKWLRR